MFIDPLFLWKPLNVWRSPPIIGSIHICAGGPTPLKARVYLTLQLRDSSGPNKRFHGGALICEEDEDKSHKQALSEITAELEGRPTLLHYRSLASWNDGTDEKSDPEMFWFDTRKIVKFLTVSLLLSLLANVMIQKHLHRCVQLPSAC